jgi:hypothetical protein
MQFEFHKSLNFSLVVTHGHILLVIIKHVKKMKKWMA